jgi:histidine triad (HIT) family protein
MHDPNCLFCKIFKGEIPSNKVFESDNVIGFRDLHPQAKDHVLFIHKNHNANIAEMASSDPEDIIEVIRAITRFAKESGLEKTGVRIVSNSGPDAGQTIFHTHFHVLGGEQLGHFGRNSRR